MRRCRHRWRHGLHDTFEQGRHAAREACIEKGRQGSAFRTVEIAGEARGGESARTEHIGEFGCIAAVQKIEYRLLVVVAREARLHLLDEIDLELFCEIEGALVLLPLLHEYTCLVVAAQAAHGPFLVGQGLEIAQQLVVTEVRAAEQVVYPFEEAALDHIVGATPQCGPLRFLGCAARCVLWVAVVWVSSCASIQRPPAVCGENSPEEKTTSLPTV